MKHTFVICAYKESKYLEDCIRSLKAQEVKSYIKIATSTPNEYIYSIANKYGIDVFVNNMKKENNISNIGNDWQFAYNIAETGLVTIAHQDDIYLKNYTKDLLKYKKKYRDMTLFTTPSITLKDGRVKLGKVEFIKRWSVTLGNPIIAPSCAYDKRLCPKDLFISSFQFALDWECVLRLAKLEGRFVLSKSPGICYRVHDGAATKKSILNHSRQMEESIMFDRLLPKPIAGIVKKLYQSSYKAYF